jgi:hypothetical protein
MPSGFRLALNSHPVKRQPRTTSRLLRSAARRIAEAVHHGHAVADTARARSSAAIELDDALFTCAIVLAVADARPNTGERRRGASDRPAQELERTNERRSATELVQGEKPQCVAQQDCNPEPTIRPRLTAEPAKHSVNQ